MLFDTMRTISSEVKALKQYFKDTANPITVIAVNKKRNQLKLINELSILSKYISILVVVDAQNNDLSNPYMLLWRVVNNIDAQRDIVLEPFIAIDATNKSLLDGFEREWPKDVHCTKEVLDKLQSSQVINIDEDFIVKFGLLEFNLYKNGI